MKLTLTDFGKKNLYTSILNIGRPKTGKTQSLITLLNFLKKKNLGPIWVFDFDNGAESLIRKGMEAKYTDDDIVVFRYQPKGGDKIGLGMNRPRTKEVWDEFMRDFNQLYDQIGPDGNWKPGFNGPGAIVIDTLTSLQGIILDFVLAVSAHELNDKGTDARADYGRQMAKIEEVVESTSKLPCYSIWNAHQDLQRDELGKFVSLPYVTGKLAHKIGALFGSVLFSFVEKDGQYMWLTKPEGAVVEAGVRLRENLPPKILQDYALIL